MKRKHQIDSSAQVPTSNIQEAFKEIQNLVRHQIRGATLSFVQGLFDQEMEELCGKPFSRKTDSGCHRGGSDPGSVILEGRRVSVKKPRAKKEGEEVPLQTYSALQSFDLYCDRVMKQMLAGTSTRNYEPLLDEISGSAGLKKSTVSKAFTRGSLQALEALNGRTLSGHNWLAVLIDGIEFQKRHIIVALGITTKGEKLILGLREGSTENHEVCKDLLQSLLERGLKIDESFLFILDGSKSLRKAVSMVFGERFPVQRCVRHKERNIVEYLPQEYHSEFYRRWKMIHSLKSFAEASREYDRLLHWLKNINEEAHASLEEAQRETLTVIELKAPMLLRKTLLSTNPIESAFSKVRGITHRIKNWNAGKNKMITRWSASSLLEAEKSFRTIKGFEEISVFMKTLKEYSLSEKRKAA